MERSYSEPAIQAVNMGKRAFCKMLSANDTGKTGGHQSGIYIPKTAVSILFDVPGKRGENKKKYVKIRWQNDFTTDSVFTYYGKGTRNEYRITRFGRGFELLQEKHTGDLFVFVQLDAEDYEGFLLSSEDDIDAFLNYFGMSPADTGLIEKQRDSADSEMERRMAQFIAAMGTSFPETKRMSEEARSIFDAVYNERQKIIQNPDERLLDWIQTEYVLFRKIEDALYGDKVYHGFDSMDTFIAVANSILNRRKSRAGKSLENHLAAIFDGNSLSYDAQLRSEGHKTPDFIFPGGDVYHDMSFDFHKLVFLGAKTTCKDRWRQVITEADRIPVKHLFTLQQGISEAQMEEMKTENVVLVVPKAYIKNYPAPYKKDIMDLQTFIAYVKEKEMEP